MPYSNCISFIYIYTHMPVCIYTCVRCQDKSSNPQRVSRSSLFTFPSCARVRDLKLARLLAFAFHFQDPLVSRGTVHTVYSEHVCPTPFFSFFPPMLARVISLAPKGISPLSPVNSIRVSSYDIPCPCTFLTYVFSLSLSLSLYARSLEGFYYKTLPWN